MAIIYVKSGSTGNGSAWNNAYGSLTSAITAAQSGDEIWIAAGTYKPTTGTDRTASFTLKNNVAIYGGFAGTETALNQRNITTNVTILSGEIGIAGIADNAYHVVSATGTISTPLGNSSILDGFTITGGNANGTTGNQDDGGGMYVSGASPTLRNITFRDNNGTNGGALYNENGSNPVLIDTVFEYNTATTNSIIQGGGFTGATDNNPLFVNAKGDDLRLKSGSPALDAGDYNLFYSLRNALAFGVITFSLTILGGNNFAQAVTMNVNAQSNIYGAGQSIPPSQVGGAGILPPVYNFSAAAKQVLTFSQITGIINYGVPLSNGPDGADIRDVTKGAYFHPSLNGISGIIGEGIGRYLVGVFLDNSTPTSPAPNPLNFSGNYNFKELSPLLKQTFFIGDGLTGTGFGDIQKFNVPEKATRLFLGFFDGPGVSSTGEIPVGFYGDNTGSFIAEFQIQPSPISNIPESTTPIPEPSTILGIVTLGLGALFSKKHKQDDNNDD
ncbi:PEP-CTERM sorting domain-containing protein [Microcystis aeruginosa]|nr:PEP-CTERM sorting domain-containing protein [Microcystis aeruginosa]